MGRQPAQMKVEEGEHQRYHRGLELLERAKDAGNTSQSVFG